MVTAVVFERRKSWGMRKRIVGHYRPLMGSREKGMSWRWVIGEGGGGDGFGDMGGNGTRMVRLGLFGRGKSTLFRGVDSR
ncbi:hypothetical protein GOBAR_DD27600 [Gossypium barbadense]|nr:hypothetical protein GOBAR_DD27600 [Gossypium barbadense]